MVCVNYSGIALAGAAVQNHANILDICLNACHINDRLCESRCVFQTDKSIMNKIFTARLKQDIFYDVNMDIGKVCIGFTNTFVTRALLGKIFVEFRCPECFECIMFS